jgi:hypothetical protein
VNEKQLKRGNELEKEIKVIRAAMESLKRPEKGGGKRGDYNLHVSAFKDGSAPYCDLAGANVANDVLDAIYAELQNQLAVREEEFTAL